MSLVHMIFLYFKAEFMEHPDAADTENYLLLKPVNCVPAVQVCSSLPVFSSIAFHIRIKKKYRDTPACQAFHIILPCLYHDIAPFDLDGQTLAISASIGTALYPEAGDDREQLFRHADAGMYAAKRRGS